MRSKVQALLNKAQVKRNSMEYGSVTISKVKNLSRSDVDDIILYCNEYLTYGHIQNLMKPLGSLREVFENSNIKF